jgi:hypothetical protein
VPAAINTSCINIFLNPAQAVQIADICRTDLLLATTILMPAGSATALNGSPLPIRANLRQFLLSEASRTTQH